MKKNGKREMELKRYSFRDVQEAFKKAGGSAECLVHELTGHSPGELDEIARAEIKTISLRNVTGITLLSLEEYLKAEDIVPKLDGWWWLRSPGLDSYSAAVVIDDGSLFDGGFHVVLAGGSVRPALRLNPESDNLQIGDGFRAAGHTWTVIPGNLALCDGSIGEHCFREDWQAPDANDYEASNVKRFIEAWARKHGLVNGLPV